MANIPNICNKVSSKIIYKCNKVNVKRNKTISSLKMSIEKY